MRIALSFRDYFAECFDGIEELVSMLSRFQTHIDKSEFDREAEGLRYLAVKLPKVKAALERREGTELIQERLSK